MSTDNGKLKVDLQDLTLGELDEIDEVLDRPLAELMGGKGQFRAMAAAAWIVKRRTDPAFTLEDARALRMGDMELVSGEALAAELGGGPQPSLESGASIPET
ncbi:MAG TPA: hypothetical protein VKB59_22490 [Micromonosporaceae bacterium]|nr:hypothetical protein [Micromonosporaceae bacterium]